jgi:hypothetical protein
MTQRIYWDLGKKSEEEMEILLNKNMYSHHDLYEAYKAGMDDMNITPVGKEIALSGFTKWIIDRGF